MKAAGYYDFEALKVMTGRDSVSKIQEVLDENGIKYVLGYKTISTCPEAIVNKGESNQNGWKP